MVAEFCVSRTCEDILQRKTHAMAGISPFNSYYSETTIKNIISWCQSFKNYHLFVPDNLPYYNFLGSGYSAKRAKAKTEHQWRYLRNKIFRAFMHFGIEPEMAKCRLVTTSELENNTQYNRILESIFSQFENDPDFRTACMNASKAFIKINTSASAKGSANISVEYLIRELPLYLDTPKIVGVQESVFVYHENISFFTDIFVHRENVFLSPNQGHVILKINK